MMMMMWLKMRMSRWRNVGPQTRQRYGRMIMRSGVVVVVNAVVVDDAVVVIMGAVVHGRHSRRGVRGEGGVAVGIHNDIVVIVAENVVIVGLGRNYS